jgi:WD40 repeat protein
VTALASCGVLLVAAEGPFLRFYHAKTSQYIASKRVFKAQAVHGISVYSESYDDVIKLVIWGGRLIRALEISFAPDDHHKMRPDVYLSEVAKLPDWILDLDPQFSSLEDEAQGQQGMCVAVTAHNALLQITILRRQRDGDAQRCVDQQASSMHDCYSGLITPYSTFTLSIVELTSSSRSILYSAHVFWESENCVLVAAGTAFGEIMYWSWNRHPDIGATSRVHRVFLGHEGSIFGVRISKELPSDCCQSLKRVIASCSDDRTIRIWDVSDVAIRASPAVPSDQTTDSERTRHTGFSSAAFDPNMVSSSQCLAIGWGHASRVWKVQFLDSTPCEGALFLVSAGEDASTRTWKLSPNKGKETSLPYQLVQQDCANHHSGKNIWSSSVHGEVVGGQQVVCGGADAKITTYPLVRDSDRKRDNGIQEYTVLDILSLAKVFNQQSDPRVQHKSSKQAEFFRSYCFLDQESFLLTTNSGNILVVSLQSDSNAKELTRLSNATFVDQLHDLSGYSVCTSDIASGVAFIAGSTGTIYTFSNSSHTLTKLGSVDGKVGEMLAATVSRPDGSKTVALLATLVGQKEAQLLYVDIASNAQPCIVRTVIVHASELLTGSMITSMALTTSLGASFLYLGFRRGSVAVYTILNDPSTPKNQANLFRIIDKVHGDETVTALQWVNSSEDGSVGHLTSVGRDGRLAIHQIDLDANTVELVHNLVLPIGPNIEGVYFYQGRLLVHGFSSKRWVLYDVTLEEEIMSMETGGAHRSWAFQPRSDNKNGGTLVWTRASSMHICSQTGSNHGVMRPGGHGREVKAVAVSQGQGGHHIATGAEDTNIKIFEYVGGELLCRTTLRRHTTGIQHLQWSENGQYLFSSGGCEEFYIWKIRKLPLAMGIGIVCELSYAPESEHADLRIMSFDVTQRDAGYDIGMVFSDSSIKVSFPISDILCILTGSKVYRYMPTVAVKWKLLAKGLYSTSCLTQCIFASSDCILTAGTDGHVVMWPLPSTITQSPVGATMSTLPIAWQEPVRIHQSSSKVMAVHCFNDSTKLVVSGGDDGSLALLLTRSTWSTTPPSTAYATAPVLLSRVHGSAVTACAIMTHTNGVYILTSGNDQWIRLWEMQIRGIEDDVNQSVVVDKDKPTVNVRRVGKTKTKTNVADVSSMAILEAQQQGMDARVLICGVGMEVLRLEWEGEETVRNSSDACI